MARPWRYLQRPSAFYPWMASGVMWLGLAAWNPPAHAYRPFDGTDAAVAKEGELEVELQRAGAARTNGQTTLIAPAVVLNFGLDQSVGGRLRGAGRDAAVTVRPQQSVRGRRVLERRIAAGKSAGSDWSQYRHRIRGAFSGHDWRQRLRRELGRHRVAALGLGKHPSERCDSADARSPRRHFPRGDRRGALEVESPTGRRGIFRGGVQSVAHGVWPGRSDLAGTGRPQL